MAKKSNKEKRHKRRFNSDIIFKGVYVFIIAAILSAVVKNFFNNALNTDYFIVKDVQMLCVDKGMPVLNSDLHYQFEKGVNIFKLDLKKLKQNTELVHPEFKDIKVNRVLPDKIEVLFKTRTPVLQIRSTKFYLVSEDMVVLPSPKSQAQNALPVVSGIHISEGQLPKTRRLNSSALRIALKLIQQIKQSQFIKKYKIREIDVYDEHSPVIYMENGIQIKIAECDFAKKETVLLRVLDDLQAKRLVPKSIDLRFDDVVVTPR